MPFYIYNSICLKSIDIGFEIVCVYVSLIVNVPQSLCWGEVCATMLFQTCIVLYDNLFDTRRRGNGKEC